VQKRLLKRAIADRVPAEILQRKKFGMPTHFTTFMSQQPGVVRELLLGSRSYTGSVFPKDWLRGLLADAAQMRRNFPVLYALIVLEVWHRLFVEEKVYDRPTMTLSDLCRVPLKVRAADQ
jgi:hypothetical protein